MLNKIMDLIKSLLADRASNVAMVAIIGSLTLAAFQPQFSSSAAAICTAAVSGVMGLTTPKNSKDD